MPLLTYWNLGCQGGGAFLPTLFFLVGHQISFFFFLLQSKLSLKNSDIVLDTISTLEAESVFFFK